MKIRSALTFAVGRLELNGVSEFRLNGEHLVSGACGFERKELFFHMGNDISEQQFRKLKKFISLKIRGYPLSWILKNHDFCGMKMLIKPGVFVPRPETEELALMVYKESLKLKSPKILDFCCGSGCIGLYAAFKNPSARVLAIDISSKAVSCCIENMRNLGLKNYRAVKSRRLPDGGDFDILVSNPPYIPSGLIKNLDAEVRLEPRAALDGGADGLDMIRYIEKKAGDYVRKGGKIYVEFSDGQSAAVKRMFSRRYKNVRIIKDLQGKARFLEACNGQFYS